MNNRSYNLRGGASGPFGYGDGRADIKGEMLMNDMQRRLNRLECNISETKNSVSKIDKTTAVIESNYAKKSDVQDLKIEIKEILSRNFRWSTGILVSIIAAGAGVCKLFTG